MTYIIAEAGVDHEGDMLRAMRLLNAAHDAGADCFKIQYYYREFKGAHRILPWLPAHCVQDLIREAHRREMDFLITPHDEWALDWICRETNLNTIKIGSHDWHLLPAAYATGKRLIVSTGGKSIDELDMVGNQMSIHDSWLHCVSEYPCPIEHANLQRMLDNDMDGYSDHTEGTTAALAAVALGADIIEKHMTLERDVEGRNDTFCSLLPAEWPKFVGDIRSVEKAIAQ